MRFIVVQMGARHGYAVPAILEGAGMLERFYTDAAAHSGLSSRLLQWVPAMGCRGVLARYAARRVPGCIRGKTNSFAGTIFWTACRRAFGRRGPADKLREHLRWTRALGCAMAERGFGRATHLYSTLGECGPMLVEAKRRGLIVVSEIYILLSTERIEATERRAFPGW